MMKIVVKKQGGMGMTNSKKKPFFKRWWFILIVLIIAITAFSGGGDDEPKDVEDQKVTSNTSESESESSPDSEPEAESEVIEVGIGTPATISDVSFTVNSVEETKEIKSGNQFIENAVTEGKFILANVTVSNEKKESITISSSFFKIMTSDGVEYDPNTDGSVMMAMADEDDFFLEQINPGLSKTGTVVFEVGESLDLNTTVLKCQTGFWGTESVEINLKQ